MRVIFPFLLTDTANLNLIRERRFMIRKLRKQSLTKKEKKKKKDKKSKSFDCGTGLINREM